MKFGKAYTITNALFLVLNLAILTPTLEAMSPSVPKGTILKLILKDNLSTKTSKEGDPFAAELAEDVVIRGYTMLHKGATIEGVISKMEEPKRLGGLKGKASMVLRFDRIRTHGGEEPMVASLVSVHDPVDGSKQPDKVKDEGEVQSKTDVKDMATKGAIGVAAGTVLGAIFGNVSRGLLLGSIGGAVAILAPKGNDVTLSPGTGLQIRLDRDLEVK
jgi:hypothetical protein